MFGTHGGVEIGHGGVLALRVAGTPCGEETDRQAAEHTQNPHGVAIADAALIFVGRGIEALVEPRFDAPIRTDALQPVLRGQALWREATEQIHRLGLVFPEMAIELCDLLDMGETDLFSGGRLGMDLTALPPAPIQFLGPRHPRGARQRGKKPPAWRRSVRGVCAGFLFGYP